MTVTADTFLNPVREFSQLGVKEIGYELGEGDEITYLPVRGYVEREIPLLANFIELMGRKAVTQTLASQVYYSQREARFNRWEEGSRLDPFRFLAMRMADVIIARGLLEGRRPNYSLAQILGAQHLFGMRYEPIRPNYHGEFDNYTYYPPRIRSNNFTVHGVANYCHKAVQTANPDRSRVLLTGVNLLYEP
ncbi:hypothetical protein KC660_00030 [Candidatus Dojkabacteria bacterium]|uniref:Uncharacterized protein n=1 Tax=Candidatus Dojkabacteria bacterium TaxID=2099670 RepID=A0A955RHX6_9BACT|nr:hypothetical protein [Candidatus Dojkabacteria bacterium]